MRAIAGLLALLTVGAAVAADLPVRGTVALDEDLVVGPGDALVLAPGTLVVGPGRLVVHGALRSEGTPAQPVRLATAVILDGDPSTLASTRFLGVAGAALTVRSAALRLYDVSFDDVGDGLVASAGADVTLRNARFRATERPLDVDGGRLRAEDVLFVENARPARLAASDGADLAVANATFVGEGLEVRATGSGRVTVSGSHFAGARAAAFRVAGPGNATVESASNRFLDAPVAFAVAAGGFRVESRSDRFDGCETAVDGDAAPFRAENATYRGGCVLRAATAEPAGTAALPLIGGAAGLLLVGAGWASTRAGRRTITRRLDAVDRARVLAALPPEGATPADVARALGLPRAPTARALEAAAAEGAVARGEDGRFAPPKRPDADARGPSATERRILEEIRARPGRAQSDIAESLGLSRQALHYHVKKLEKEGLVAKVVRGRETLCYPKGGEPAAEADGLS